MKFVFVIISFVGLTLAAPQPKSLKEDLNDFVKLIPIDKIKDIAHKYLKNDPEFQAVIKYLHGPEWAALVAKVTDKQEVKDFKAYFQNAGIDVNKIISCLYDNNTETKTKDNIKTFGVKNMINEMKALIPVKEIVALLDEKMNNSKNIQDLYNQLSNNKAKKLANEMKQLKEVQELITKLQSMGIDAKNIIEEFSDFFGWSEKANETKTLKQDFSDFGALIPVDKIKAIARKYIKNDAEVQDIIKYLHSPVWTKLVDKLSAHATIIEFKTFLQSSGIVLDKTCTCLKNLIAESKLESHVQTYGLKSMIEEIKAILPLKEIFTLLDEKITNSKQFQDLYEFVSSEKFEKLVQEVLKTKEVRELINKLKAMKINVKKVGEDISNFLGWSKEEIDIRTLEQDLSEFMSLIPDDKINAIFQKYVNNDAEVQSVIKYLRSPAWAELVAKIAAKPTTKECKSYFLSVGIDLDKIIAVIEDYIANIKPGDYTKTYGVKTMVNEIKALLPIKQLNDLLKHKMNTSKQFKELYITLSSKKVRELVDEVGELKEVVEIIAKIEGAGIDVKKITKDISNFLGWH